MAYPGFATLKPGWEKRTIATRGGRRLGQEGYMYPGRWFKFAIAGEALLINRLHTSITAIDAHDLDLVTAVAALGVRTVTVTLGATAALADEYADGFLIINDEIGEGQQYLIRSHPAAALSATLLLTLDEEDGIALALTAASQSGLVHNLCFDIVIYPTTPSAAAIGATCIAWANNDLGWLQYRGQGMALIDATAPGAGAPLAPSNATAGALELFDIDVAADAGADFPPVAQNMDAVTVSGEHAAVLWMI